MPASQIFQAIHVLNDAAIKLLPTAGPEVIPAPGPNKIINFIKATVIVDCQAGAYADVGDDASMAFYVSDKVSNVLAKGSSQTNTNLANLLTDDSEPVYAAFGLDAEVVLTNLVTGVGDNCVGSVRALADAVDQPLLLIVSGNVGNFTGGHADNTMKVIVDYTIITLP